MLSMFDLGTYSTGKQQQCTKCPQGKYCPNTTLANVLDCPNGLYSFGVAAECSSCPQGYQCPNKDGTANSKCVHVSTVKNLLSFHISHRTEDRKIRSC